MSYVCRASMGHYTSVYGVYSHSVQVQDNYDVLDIIINGVLFWLK